ncbi:homogentisate 1,2-dioxygenase [Ramaria rubella]|nr:homogentisate 1,2-dioxygenase [Ramaria rubella]
MAQFASDPSTTAGDVFVATDPSERDPYVYQTGFGNRFASDAIPGTLPLGQNNPQRCKYGLYAEQVTGTAFVAPRCENQNAWLYRIRPAVAHDGFTALARNPDLESNFLPANPRISLSASQLSWQPIGIPSVETDFIDGLKTVAGCGDSSLREGLAVHLYAANVSMGKKAFVNTDGDFLIVPSQGRLDIQTEFGKLMVRPGEIVVIQRGIRFKVSLPNGPSHGYIQEVFGAHYELPELGPLGANGLANARDFEYPVASFDIDQTPWDIVYKVSGSLHLCKQRHTPFDVVAWHGNYVPYKYALEKLITVGSLTRDHIDPSIFCVLTARSKTAGTPLADFLAYGPRWDVAYNTFRPSYYHRNAASELLGLIYGAYPGRAGFQPGGLNFTPPFSPHGPTSGPFKAASEAELKPQWISVGSLAFMFESSMTLALTEYAIKRANTMRPVDPKTWEGLKPLFLDNLDQANEDLRALGLAELNA